MKRKLINSQLNNFKTYELYKRQCLTLAENVFIFENLNPFIDVSYVNKSLVRKGSIAFFIDEVLGLLALPYVNVGNLDVYNRPKKIQVIGQNGYSRILDSEQFVIMWDNFGKYPIWLDIIQYAERMALDTRTMDINISQQKTPRIWKTSEEQKKSLNDLLNNIDGCENAVTTYEGLDIEGTNVVLAPAPYVADKIQEHKDKLWNEFLRLIGVSNMSFEKKERNIKDEILASQGGTIASRYSRYGARVLACEQIAEKLGVVLNVKFYDNLPNMLQDFYTDFIDEGDEEDV